MSFSSHQIKSDELLAERGLRIFVGFFEKFFSRGGEVVSSVRTGCCEERFARPHAARGPKSEFWPKLLLKSPRYTDGKGRELISDFGIRIADCLKKAVGPRS